MLYAVTSALSLGFALNAAPLAGAPGLVRNQPVSMNANLGDMVGQRTKPKIASSITELIGNTPLLQLGRSVEGCDATILAKLESFELDDALPEPRAAVLRLGHECELHVFARCAALRRGHRKVLCGKRGASF